MCAATSACCSARCQGSSAYTSANIASTGALGSRCALPSAATTCGRQQADCSESCTPGMRIFDAVRSACRKRLSYRPAAISRHTVYQLQTLISNPEGLDLLVQGLPQRLLLGVVPPAGRQARLFQLYNPPIKPYDLTLMGQTSLRRACRSACSCASSHQPAASSRRRKRAAGSRARQAAISPAVR